jgi:hypothetical protein
MKKSRSRSMASIEFARLQRRMSDESVLIVWPWIAYENRQEVRILALCKAKSWLGKARGWMGREC